MRNKVFYEWDYETVDADGDIQEHNHADRLSSFTEDSKTNTLVLVRDVECEANGLQDRTWAYVKDGKLPEFFSDSLGNPMSPVPQRFHKELASYL